MVRLRDPREPLDSLTPPVLRPEPVYVAPPPPGWDSSTGPLGSGTIDDPFHSITKRTEEVHGGGVLLRGGHYNEQVAVTNLHGTDERRIDGKKKFPD